LRQGLAVAFETAKFTMLYRHRAVVLLRDGAGTDFVLVDVQTNDAFIDRCDVHATLFE